MPWGPFHEHFSHRYSNLMEISFCFQPSCELTHWGQVTHICVGKPTTIGSDNGLSPGRRQDIIWTIAGILLIGPLGTNFSEILIKIQTFSFKKMHLKMSSAKWRPFCLGLNVLNMFQIISLTFSPSDIFACVRHREISSYLDIVNTWRPGDTYICQSLWTSWV